MKAGFAAGPRLHTGECFDDLLTIDDVDRAITAGGLRRPAVRLVRDGEVIDPAKWTRRARTGSVTVDDLVDPARTLALVAGGATVVLQSLQRWWEPVTRFCHELEATLTHGVQANAYLTPAGATGLAPHHDTHDVFVLQLHGTKRWVVREPLVEAPLRRHRSQPDAAARQPVLLETELTAGSCLYLPRGTIHSATSEDGTSLHLTIGILATTAHDVIRRVLTLLEEHPALRRSLPPGWADDPMAAEEAVRDVLAELHDAIGSIDAADMASDVVEHLATRHRSSRQPDLRGQLLELDALADLADHTVVTRRTGVEIEVTTDERGDTLRLAVGPRRIELPAALAPALDRVLDGRTLCAADLSDLLDQPSRLVLIRRLVREGLVRTVTTSVTRHEQHDMRDAT